MIDEGNDLRRYLEGLSRIKAGAQELLTIPVEARGHVFRNRAKHPLQKTRTQYLSSNRVLDAWRALKEGSSDKEFTLGLGDLFAGSVTPCAHCGLYEWNISQEGMKPLLECPFPSGVRKTVVRFSVPSGRIALGCSAVSLFFSREQLDAGIGRYEAWLGHMHELTKLYEVSGFVQAEAFDQDNAYVYRCDRSSSFILTNRGETTCRKPLAKNVFPHQPQFFFCDASLWERQRASREPLAKQGWYFEEPSFFEVEPGDYECVISYGKWKGLPKQWVQKLRLPARALLTRIGEATPLLSEAESQDRVQKCLETHPWHTESYMKQYFNKDR